MPGADDAPSYMETIPDPALEIILCNLDSDDKAALYVTSNTLFCRCSELLHSQKRKCGHNNPTPPRRLRNDIWLDNVEYELERNFWDFSLIRRRGHYPICQVIPLDIKKLTTLEIKRLIENYEDRMRYMLFYKKKCNKSYASIVGIRTGYSILKKFYRRPALDYNLVFKVLDILQYPAGFWVQSYEDISDRKREQHISDQRQKTLRKYGSEIHLRTITSCPRIANAP